VAVVEETLAVDLALLLVVLAAMAEAVQVKLMQLMAAQEM
jgi:hypothetical protein